VCKKIREKNYQSYTVLALRVPGTACPGAFLQAQLTVRDGAVQYGTVRYGAKRRASFIVKAHAYFLG